MPLIPALGRQRRVNLCEFETSLVYSEFQDRIQSYTEKPCLKKPKMKNKKETSTLPTEVSYMYMGLTP